MPTTAGPSSPGQTPPTPLRASSDRKPPRSPSAPWSNWFSKAMRYTASQSARLMPSTTNPSIMLSSTEHSGPTGTRARRATSDGAASGPLTSSGDSESMDDISADSPGLSYYILLKWSTWAALATISGFIINAAIIHPTFRGARLARESLDLDQWTALKDYQAYCQNILKTTNYSTYECSEALSKPLPAPPSFLENFIRRLTRRFLRTGNGSVQPRSDQPLLPPLAQYLSAGMKSSGIFLWVILVNVFFVVFLKALNCSGDVKILPFWAIMLCLILFDVPIGEEDSSWWTILMTGISMVVAICYCTS